ncbi:winged helix DNA-binding domain-containing protein [Prescottella defluvii]|uniref:winged helix DNA-binding domain-containing protein n=1 Tax=Prescottella defluvii TaxID=1323361 RepID=UPI0004F31A4A|nr:winged helix DNA-binding domain-containing protein [Prescottella defluvii]
MTASPSGDSATVRTSDVVAFRLHAHNLTARRPIDDLLEVAGACGVQNSPPGSALLALHARVEGVTGDLVDHLVAEDRSLLQSWCMRGAPFFFPAAAAPTFTTGVLPATEGGRLQLIRGVEQALERLGMGLDEAVDLIADEIHDVLSGRQLAIGELGEELAERVARTLPPTRRETWQSEGPYGTHQPLGEAVVHFCIRILTLRGIVCLAPRAGNKAPFVLLDEWLGGPLPQTEPDVARADLLRRYLHCYGPSTRKDFAAWLGVRTGDVDPWWTSVEDELTPVDVDGRRGWILAADLDALRAPPRAYGVRLLPPHDPYLQMRDRQSIVDKMHHAQLWKTVGDPGAVLADGQIVGTWRPRKSGRRLTVTVDAFGPSSPTVRDQVRAEAEQVAVLRGASTVQVEFAS